MTKDQLLSLWNADNWEVMSCGVYFTAHRADADIGIQYMKLPHEKGAAALGQELSAFGWALYNLDDEDEYPYPT